MKYLSLILLTIVSFAAKAQTPTTELYEMFVLKQSTGKPVKDYGLTPANPVTAGIYADMDQQKMMAQTARFEKTFVWPDGTEVDFSQHTSINVNDVNLEKYTLVKPGTKDTITLYVDKYKDAPVSAPKGLAIYTKQQLATELAPLVATLTQLDTIADKFSSEKAKELSFGVMGVLQRTTGLTYFMDKDVLDPLMAVIEANMDLKALLLRSYICNKLLANATGQPNANIKAFNAMVKDYNAVMKLHPEVMKGNLDALMKPKA